MKEMPNNSARKVGQTSTANTLWSARWAFVEKVDAEYRKSNGSFRHAIIRVLQNTGVRKRNERTGKIHLLSWFVLTAKEHALAVKAAEKRCQRAHAASGRFRGQHPGSRGRSSRKSAPG